ncbi:hypothetical protein [Clostridium sp.]|uniref:hypothetical protein n=1 Tax=Clostridium sp. TaxID=1506 RepID=UPI0028FE240C|nr:hypothetical protein [Clostridium sp.]MDU7260741.1 hypothetical protein [Clostridium butyricum]MDU1068193.1 hypothetical protein [Clostridium sp.]MDU2679767.1 hypothetical protein [Clostridium sp.]MDU4211948.1 hypothetical protein [Clostridium sp.]MDU5175107.1 hypothetical protein [Clostridium sp.]
MANNLYGGTLTLQNGFTSVLQQFKSQMNNAGNALNNFNNLNRNSANKTKDSWNSAFSSMNGSLNRFSNNTLSTITKITAGWLSVKGAIGGVKKILESGSEFQNASTFLKAVYGDKVGVEKFKWATNEANATPFSESEVASGLARAHSLGLADDSKSFKMYEDMGSFAKIQGVGDLNSAIDAIVDAQSSNWVRLQTITGIKREGLEAFANKNNLGKFSNKKGQVTDSQKLMEVLQKYMDYKGITGMTDKFSKTLSGRLSTLKGNFTKMMADIGGINEKGEVENGSLFDQAGKGLERLIKSINAFAKSESFDKVKDALGKVGNSFINAFDYLTEHPETVSLLLKLGGALVGLKVITSLISPISNLSGGLGGIFSLLSTKSVILAGGLLTLGSVLSENGVLHKGINSLLNDIAGNKKGEQKDYIDRSVTGLAFLGNRGAYGIASLMGNDVWKNSLDIQFKDMAADSQRRENELNGLYDNWSSDVSYKTAKETLASTNKTISSNNNGNSNVTVNIDKIEKTADTDELIMQLTNILNKNKDRNAIVY